MHCTVEHYVCLFLVPFSLLYTTSHLLKQCISPLQSMFSHTDIFPLPGCTQSSRHFEWSYDALQVFSLRFGLTTKARGGKFEMRAGKIGKDDVSGKVGQLHKSGNSSDCGKIYMSVLFQNYMLATEASTGICTTMKGLGG